MVDDDTIVHPMTASTPADKMPIHSAGLQYVLVDIAIDYLIWKLSMKVEVQGQGLCLLMLENPDTWTPSSATLYHDTESLQ